MSSKKTVLVLAADYSPLHFVIREHAIRMVFRGVAVVEEEHPTKMFGPFKEPVKMRLLKYIPSGWYFTNSLAYSKAGVMRRDQYKCAYCGAHATTIDHVVPRSKGGQDSWANCVASCKPCNSKKDSKSLKEMGWTLPFTPTYPRRDQLVNAKLFRLEDL